MALKTHTRLDAYRALPDTALQNDHTLLTPRMVLNTHLKWFRGRACALARSSFRPLSTKSNTDSSCRSNANAFSAELSLQGISTENRLMAECQAIVGPHLTVDLLRTFQRTSNFSGRSGIDLCRTDDLPSSICVECLKIIIHWNTETKEIGSDVLLQFRK